jgi:hypothetical protein
MTFISPDISLIELLDKSRECKEIAIIRVTLRKHPMMMHELI